MRKRSARSLIAVLGVCSVLLPILALFDCRWLGQLSVAEVEIQNAAPAHRLPTPCGNWQSPPQRTGRRLPC
jgi:hypothetical protein